MNALQPFLALVKRELIRDLRRPRPFAVFTGIAIISMVVVYSSYPELHVTPMELSRRSMMIFGGLATTLYCVAIFVLPGYAATAIVVEREQDTFDLLLLTLTRPSAVILAKCVSALGFFVLIILAMLPFLGAAFFLVGIDTRNLVLVTINLSVTATTCVCAGIVSSTLVQNTPRAVSLAYMWAFVMLVGYLIPFGVAAAVFSIGQADPAAKLFVNVFIFLAALSPISGGGIVMFGVGGYANAWYAPIGVVLGQGLFCFIALFIAWKRIRRPSTERNFTTVDLPQPAELPGQKPVVLYEDDPLPPWPQVPDKTNPMFARERLQIRLNHRVTPLRMLGALFFMVPIMLVLFLVLAETFPNTNSVDAAIVVCTWMVGLMIFMAFVTPAMSATAWSREYERDTIDLLRTTLLTSPQLVLGKSRATLIACVFPLLLAVTTSLPLVPYALAGWQPIVLFLLGVVSLGVSIFLCNAIGTLAGLLARRSATCVLYGYVATMGLLALPFLLAIAEMFVRLLLTLRFFPGNPFDYAVFSPIVAYGSILNTRSEYQWWLMSMAGHLVLAFLFLGLASFVLHKRHMSEP